MKILSPANISDFNSAMRIYYNLDDIRISDVNVHNSHTADLYHKHETITEILFVISGSVEVKIKRDDKIDKFKVSRNKVIVFNPKESHAVKSIGKNARVIVFKYLKMQDKNLLNLFINDWESD